jgi:hypothetical protein
MDDKIMEKWAEGFEAECAAQGIDALELLKFARDFDGTGPGGLGPMTGRGLGLCGLPPIPAVSKTKVTVVKSKKDKDDKKEDKKDKKDDKKDSKKKDK